MFERISEGLRAFQECCRDVSVDFQARFRSVREFQVIFKGVTGMFHGVSGNFQGRFWGLIKFYAVFRGVLGRIE